MRKLLSALTLVVLLTVNTLADDIGTTSVTEPAPTESSLLLEVIVVIAIAIPNLLKSRQGG